jgi:hypothetical protein
MPAVYPSPLGVSLSPPPRPLYKTVGSLLSPYLNALPLSHFLSSLLAVRHHAEPPPRRSRRHHAGVDATTPSLCSRAAAVEPLPARAAAPPLAVVPCRSSSTLFAIRGTSPEVVPAIQTHRRSYVVHCRRDRATHQLDHPRIAIRTPCLTTTESLHAPQG